MKKHFLGTALLIGATFLFLAARLTAQGCVAVRQLGGCGNASSSTLLTKGQWQAGINYRYFRSFRHFRGDHEETERVENGTEVINITHIAEIGLSYSLSNRFSVSVNLPVISYDRASLYEHYGNSTTANPEQKRFHTKACGIGDLRLAGSFWLLNPEHSPKYNISLGLGIKLPTGNENVQDEFHRRKATDGSDSIVVRAVDQSIQLGDGGVGINLEIQGYVSLFNRATLYASGSYLSNPRNTNNTLTRGTLTGVDPLIAYHSVADQYFARLGINYTLWPAANLSASLGTRLEGVPSKDLIGKSEGFRRPGYILAAEPGLFFQRGQANIALTVPLALYRNRVKSVYDLADPTGQRHGDAAFADYSINLSLAWRFGRRPHTQTDQPQGSMWKEAGH